MTGRGTGKDLKIFFCSHSPSNTNAARLIISHNAPCTEAFVISGYEKAQESDRQLPQPEEEKKRGKPPLFLFLPPTPPTYFPQRSRSAFAGSIWVHLSQTRQAGGPLCPLWLQGLSVLQCGSLLLGMRGAQACPLNCLDHLKAPIHPFPRYTRPNAHPKWP